MNHTLSEKLFHAACERIPGGVNSPVRAFRNVGRNPVYIIRGEGAYIFDADGNRYLDFCGSWGPMLLGHARQEVIEAVEKAVKNGLSFGACTPAEVEMAELLCRMIPNLEQVRLVTSGTEATMTALRLARAFTKRSKIIKFEGCYHGHADPFLIAAGSGLLTHGIPACEGVPESTAAETLCVPFNDLNVLECCLKANRDSVAAVIVEPVPGNMGLVLPETGFLENLIRLTHEAGALVIFDEVINAFRFAPTTYAVFKHLNPDLTTLGKIIGGGMPLGAVGGRKELMSQLAPLGKVYQAGTLSGNPVALAAGLATLKLIRELNAYAELEQKAARIAQTLNGFFGESGYCAHSGALFTPFFTYKKPPLRNLSDVKSCDTERFASFFRAMLDRGFYLSPAQFEANFLSIAHTDAMIDNFLASAKECLNR